jgi:hypothetical protein
MKVLILVPMVFLLALPALGQRGIGNPEGVARHWLAPAVETFTGTVVEVEIAPCEHTTGRSLLGTHLMVQSDAGESINLHLGPSSVLGSMTERLVAGQRINFEAFRTPQMAAGHLVAASLTLASGEVVTLRGDDFQPQWAAAGRDRPNERVAAGSRRSGMRAPQRAGARRGLRSTY